MERPGAVLIEGLPGSGKTTLAEALAARLTAAGTPASWWREEDAEHPATPRSLRRTAAEPGFADRCLEHWRAWCARQAANATVPVLEGSAFQSTLRFLFEYGADRASMLAYARDFDRILARVDARFVYLRPAEPRVFLEDFVYPTRGEAWVEKVAGYLAGTPRARSQGGSGVAGMTELWCGYAELCDAAVAELTLPTLALEVTPEGWREREERAFRWLTSPVR